jgi:hypothetical protein
MHSILLVYCTCQGERAASQWVEDFGIPGEGVIKRTDKGPVIKYLLGGVEDIFWGYEKNPEPLSGYEKNNRTSRGVPKS